MAKEKLGNGGLDKGNAGWWVSFFKFADDEGWLKAVAWTFIGGSRTMALLLGSIAYFSSIKDSPCLTVYLFFLLLVASLYQAADYFLKWKKQENIIPGDPEIAEAEEGSGA